jgi:hypothetical protein
MVEVVTTILCRSGLFLCLSHACCSRACEITCALQARDEYWGGSIMSATRRNRNLSVLLFDLHLNMYNDNSVSAERVFRHGIACKTTPAQKDMALLHFRPAKA